MCFIPRTAPSPHDAHRRLLMRAKPLHSLLVLLVASIVSCTTAHTTTYQPPNKLIPHGVTEAEEQFLACSASCLFTKDPNQQQACRVTCQRQANVSVVRIADLGLPRITSQKTGSVGAGAVVWFSCPPFETKCSCTGYFDCKVLDKSGCCKTSVDTCTSSGGGPETCTCDKSARCSL